MEQCSECDVVSVSGCGQDEVHDGTLRGSGVTATCYHEQHTAIPEHTVARRGASPRGRHWETRRSVTVQVRLHYKQEHDVLIYCSMWFLNVLLGFEEPSVPRIRWSNRLTWRPSRAGWDTSQQTSRRTWRTSLRCSAGWDTTLMPILQTMVNRNLKWSTIHKGY